MLKSFLPILVFIVAAEHFFIMCLEMFFIESSVANRAFNVDSKLLAKKEVKVMFANQGLYNGFLAAGLCWSLFAAPKIATSLQFFFLACVVIAAIFGALTANKKIILTQGGPAIISLIVLIILKI